MVKIVRFGQLLPAARESSVPFATSPRSKSCSSSSSQTSSDDDDDDDDDDEEYYDDVEKLSVGLDLNNDILWRQPPNQSHSDWTIEIEVLGKTIIPYHVHRGILASLGSSRRCDAFARLFSNSSSSSQKHAASKKVSRIKLEQVAAEAFPVFLDYMYLPLEPLDIHTGNATALAYLGHRFENHQLVIDSDEFWNENLQLANCHVYCHHARILQQDTVLAAVAEVCGLNLLCIRPTSPITKVSYPDLWLDILQVASQHRTDGWISTLLSSARLSHEQSLHASRLVAQVLKNRRGSISVSLFDKLTDATLLPAIHFDAAIDLLDLEADCRRVQQFKQNNNASKRSGSAVAVDAGAGTTSLTSRCISVLAKNWQELNDVMTSSSDAKATKAQLENLESDVLVALLARVLHKANKTTVEAGRDN